MAQQRQVILIHILLLELMFDCYFQLDVQKQVLYSDTVESEGRIVLEFLPLL